MNTQVQVEVLGEYLRGLTDMFCEGAEANNEQKVVDEYVDMLSVMLRGHLIQARPMITALLHAAYSIYGSWTGIDTQEGITVLDDTSIQ